MPIVADSLAAAVYGSIVAAAFLTALREADASSIESALSLLSTMGVFWLAHVWSQITAERVHEGSWLAPHVVVDGARNEWPLIEASLAPTVVLLLGWGPLTDSTASTGTRCVRASARSLGLCRRPTHTGSHALRSPVGRRQRASRTEPSSARNRRVPLTLRRPPGRLRQDNRATHSGVIAEHWRNQSYGHLIHVPCTGDLCDPR